MIPRAATRSSTRARGDARGLGKRVGPARLRRLRQRDEQRRLAERQLARLFAEIGQRSRADAFEIAAEGREREIAVEHARFGEPPLDLPGARHLPELGAEGAIVARFDQPRHLHRQRRSAGDDMAAREPLRRRARHRAPVDAVVLVEAPVLVGEQHREITRIDLAVGRWKAPAPVGQRERAQQPAVAIDDDRRADARGGEIERPEALEIAVPRRRQPQPQHEDERADETQRRGVQGMRRTPSPRPSPA